jgi:hypothetical protein
MSNLNKKISPLLFTKLYTIIENERWSSYSEEWRDSLINNLANRLAIFNNEEQELLIEMFKKYKKYKFSNDYNKLIQNVFLYLSQNINHENARFKIAKINYGENASKSSELLFRFCEKFSSELYFLQDHEIVFCKRIKDIGKIENGSNDFLVIIDDFLGTGETAKKTIVKLRAVEPSHIYVVSLVAQKRAVELLGGLGVHVIYNESHLKAISDFFGANTKIKKGIMKGIENRLGVEPEKRLGYKNSEAVISMERTPDNTLPFFWWECNASPKAPFPRKEIDVDNLLESHHLERGGGCG